MVVERRVGAREQEITVLRPHPLAFSHNYILWAYIGLAAVAAMKLGGVLAGYVSGIPFLGSLFAQNASAMVWALLVVLGTLVFSVVKVSWRYLLLGLALGLAAPPLIAYLVGGLEPWLYVAGFAVAGLGFVATELHRRAHRYILTNRGIVVEYRGIFRRIRRELLYSKITDLVMEQGLLGRIFNYGNVIPVTSSGLGLGWDASHAGIGAGKNVDKAAVGGFVAGSRGVKVARSRSFYMLYGVRDPARVHEALSEALRSREDVEYLKKILETLEERKG